MSWKTVENGASGFFIFFCLVGIPVFLWRACESDKRKDAEKDQLCDPAQPLTAFNDNESKQSYLVCRTRTDAGVEFLVKEYTTKVKW